MTDGFKEMVIKGNNDYKTSYEKEDAEHIVWNAQSRYGGLLRNVQRKLDEVQQKVETHYQFKVEIYEQLQKECSPSVERYLQKYELKKKEYTFSTNHSSSDFSIPFSPIIGTVFSRLTQTPGLTTALSVASKGSVVTIPVTVIALDLVEQSKRVKESK